MKIQPAFVYLLQSERDGRFYIGCSVNPQRRLIEHNCGENVSTRGRGPYQLVYMERFETLSAARRRENELKRKRNADYLRWLVSQRCAAESG